MLSAIFLLRHFFLILAIMLLNYENRTYFCKNYVDSIIKGYDGEKST